MAIIIKKFDTLRDGGTICIDAWIHHNGETIENESPTVSIDYSINSDTEGEWFFGLKNNGGKLITDEGLKEKIVKELELHVRSQTNLLQKLKEPKTPPNIEPTPYL